MIKKTIIEVKNLNKVIGVKQILSNISFELKPEEHLVIIGSSGAGKSMLIKCLLGLEDLSSGSIFFENNLISGNEDKQRLLNKLGVCFQSNALFDSYKTWENIAFKTLYNERSPNISKLKKFFQANFLRLDLGLVSWTYNNSLHQHDLVDVFLHLVDR